jgi:fanconi anemia group M protein
MLRKTICEIPPMPATPEKPVTLIADSREVRSGIAIKLGRFPGVTVVQQELSSGDYIIAEGFAVERKDANDFVLSVMQGRLFDQVARMQNEYPRTAVLIEGDPYGTRSAIAPEAVDGALSWLSLLSGVQVIFSPSVAVTPRLLWRMAIHATHGLGYEIPLRAAKPKNAVAQYLVEGLPSVGPKTAQILLAHFGSPHAVFTATEEELLKVAGLGKRLLPASELPCLLQVNSLDLTVNTQSNH